MAATAILLITIFVLLQLSLCKTHGHLVYALDDAYIHMAMAKNLAVQGVWGITADGFTSTSSSPLWTLLLALVYSVAGVNTSGPFVMNLVCACLSLLAAYGALREFRTPPFTAFLALLALILVTPIPALIFGGMEHSLHAALNLSAAFLAARALALQDSQNEPKVWLGLLILLPLLTAVRFEGMFLVAVISLGFFITGRARRGLLVAFLGLLPVAAYGIVSEIEGWPFLPTSVLLKSAFSRSEGWGAFGLELWHRAVVNLWEGKELVALMAVAVLADRLIPPGKEAGSRMGRTLARIFLATSALHLALARAGWFYRYEAYLVALGVIVIAVRIHPLLLTLESPDHSSGSLKSKILRLALPLLLIIPSFVCLARGIEALTNTVQATVNAFEQQYQMAVFVRRYYSGSTIALNDIGSVNFHADIHCVDLVGLATPEIAQLRLRGDYHTKDIARITATRGTRIAFVYDTWYEKLPAEWTRVGQWEIQNNVVNGSETVSIYAVDPREVEQLKARLAQFSSELPSGVLQSGEYFSSSGLTYGPASEE